MWALQTDATLNGGNEVLYAFDATNLSNELYDSTQNLAARDTVGGAVKYATPTIANGKVYVGSAQRLSVFGNISPDGCSSRNPIRSRLGNLYIRADCEYLRLHAGCGHLLHHRWIESYPIFAGLYESHHHQRYHHS